MTSVVTSEPPRAPAIGSPAWIEEYGLSGRVVCRKAQLELARRDPRVFSLEGDLGLPSVPFHEEIPERYLQIGIAEADLVSTAAGMAKRGKIPFVNSFAAFLTLRACEQVRLDVAYHRANVKLVGYYAGISGGAAGGTHHCIEDLSIVRSMPGFTVLNPADAVATYKAVFAAARHEGPVYIRVGRAETPQVYHDDFELRIGRAVRLAEGSDLTLIASGSQVAAETVEAGRRLTARGISARVLDMHTVKPIDREAIVRAAAETGALVTVEDANVVGGLGCAVAEVALQEHPVPIVRVGIDDCFCETVGAYEEMLPIYGLDAEAIVEAGERAVALKENFRPQ
jgi:transketolase